MSLLDFWFPLTTSPGPGTLDLYLAEHPSRLVIPASHRRLDRAGDPRHRGLELGGDQRAVPDRLGSREGRGSPADRRGAKQITDHALAAGFSHGFLVSAGIGLLALTIAPAAIRVTREDLSGVDPMATPVG